MSQQQSMLHKLERLKKRRHDLSSQIEANKERLKDFEIDYTLEDLKKQSNQLKKLKKKREKILERLGFPSVQFAMSLLIKEQHRSKIYKQQITKMQESVKDLEQSLALSQDASVLLQGAADAKEYAIKAKVEELVSKGLRAVFGRPDYKFCLNLKLRGSRLSLSYHWEEELEGEVIEIPLKNQSGGVVDVTVVLLRIVFLSLFEDKAKFLAMDEPFKHLSEEYIPAVAQLLKRLRDLMDLQIILITHKQELTLCGDSILYVSKRKGESVIKKLS